MESHARAYRFGSSLYDSQQIQDTLTQEIDRLEQQLGKVSVTTAETRQAIADTYRDMIYRRRELLEIIKARNLSALNESAESGNYSQKSVAIN